MHDLDVPIQDVSAAQLCLKLNQPESEPVLATTTVRSAHVAIRLDVIGASHVVNVEPASGLKFREELSCTASEFGLNVGEGLEYSTQTSGWDYHTSVSSRAVSSEEFLDTARQLATHDEEGWLVARFPGEGEGHVTALNATIDGQTVSWCTWHLYAQESVVVRSYSRARPLSAGGEDQHG